MIASLHPAQPFAKNASMIRSRFDPRLCLWTPVLLVGVAAAVGGMACGESSPVREPKPPPRAASSKGGPGDSLAKLNRRLLADSNPRVIGQAIVCENVRLVRLYGGRRAAEIAKEVSDTIYRSNDESALRRADAVLANSAFDLSCGYPPGPYPPPITGDSAR